MIRKIRTSGHQESSSGRRSLKKTLMAEGNAVIGLLEVCLPVVVSKYGVGQQHDALPP